MVSLTDNQESNAATNLMPQRSRTAPRACREAIQLLVRTLPLPLQVQSVAARDASCSSRNAEASARRILRRYCNPDPKTRNSVTNKLATAQSGLDVLSFHSTRTGTSTLRASPA